LGDYRRIKLFQLFEVVKQKHTFPSISLNPNSLLSDGIHPVIGFFLDAKTYGHTTGSSSLCGGSVIVQRSADPQFHFSD